MNNLPAGLGVGIPSQTWPDPAAVLKLLKPLWWYNWGAYWTGRPIGVNYHPMMYRDTNKKSYYKRAIGAPAVAGETYPSNAWLLGNEYDMPGQANRVPAAAIKYVNQILEMGVKEWVGPNGLLDRSYGWGWHDEYIRLGGPIPDAWGIHIYDAPAPHDWDTVLEDFYRWMYDNKVEREVVVTETNAGSGDSDAQIMLLNHIRDRLKTDRGLRAVAWFSAEYGQPADLIRDGALTEVGHAFGQHH